MSINIGTDGVNGCARLRGNPFFELFLAGLHKAAQSQVKAALSSDIHERADKTGYARACVDLWTACEAATRDVRVQTLEIGLLPAELPADLPPAPAAPTTGISSKPATRTRDGRALPSSMDEVLGA